MDRYRVRFGLIDHWYKIALCGQKRHREELNHFSDNLTPKKCQQDVNFLFELIYILINPWMNYPLDTVPRGYEEGGLLQ